MKARNPRLVLLTILVVAAIARLLAYFYRPGLHPDAFFQYLEPAWWHLHGYGWHAWEWATGLRSWVLPAYHGAWMVWLGWFGVERGATIHMCLQLHWALLSLTVVYLAWRAGTALMRDPVTGQPERSVEGGAVAALMCAVSPTLAYYSCQTLTEVPSTILLLAGYTVWVEHRSRRFSRRAALCCGALISAGVCLRWPNGLLALVPVADLAWRRQWRTVFCIVLGALGPLALFGAVDWVTWGRPFHSALQYVQYNLIEGRASEHGTSPALAYFTQIYQRAGWPFVLVVIALLADIRRSWPFALPGLLLVGYLSLIAHKEERFLLLMWPLVLIPAGALAARLLLRLRNMASPAVGWAVLGAAVALLVCFNIYGIHHRPRLDFDDRYGLYAGQSWVGQQQDVSGVLVDGRIHLNGGYFMLGKNVPQASFRPDLAGNPIFSHCVLAAQSAQWRQAQRLGFRRVWEDRGFVVMRRLSR